MLSAPARLGLAASLLVSVVVLPDALALLPHAPVGPGSGAAAPARIAVGQATNAAFVIELAGQRLKELGIPSHDAFRLSADGFAAAVAGDERALQGLVGDAGLLTTEADDPAARDIFARIEAMAAVPVLTTEAVARAFGAYADVAITPELHGGAVAAPDSGIDLPAGEVGAHVGGTCKICPDFDFGPFTPIPAFQTHASTLSTPTDCNWYALDVETGATYEFQTCPPGGSTFDTVLDLFTDACGLIASDDDGCAPQSRIFWTSGITGSVRLKVRGFSGATGDYTFAYRRVCLGDPDCFAPDQVLGPPTTDCQYIAADVNACTAARYYNVELMNGRTYTFTLCSSTCASAGASFDSAVELYFGASLVASGTSSCGDDGEVVYTVPLAGDGTYCVVVRNEAGGPTDFTLGYKVACVGAAGMDILPLTGSTTEEDCSKDMTFTADTTGTGEFDWTWTITPLAGQTATPALGSLTTAGVEASFDSVLDGAGDYMVTVTATNDCGSASNSITFNMEDRAGPVLTPIAEQVVCGTTFTVASSRSLTPAEAVQRLSELSREEMTTMMAERDPAVVEAALEEKLGLNPKSLVVLDSRVPGVTSPPGIMALGCGSPCTGFTTLQADNPYYEVFVNCDNGDYTARTGPAHSVTISSGTPQNVIFGGAGGGPGTSNLAWYVHENATFYQDPGGGQACLFDPPDTTYEPDSAGIEVEWTQSPIPGISLRLREEVVAFGDTEPNSGVRLTLGATNLASSSGPVTMGVRWQVDYQNSWDDGPLFGSVACDPFAVTDERDTEHEFTTPEIDALDFYRIQNNEAPPIFGNFSSATEIVGFPGTGKPDRLVYARWWAANGSPWNYSTLEGDPGVDSDSAVLYWYGYDVANGIPLAPGETFSRSVIIFTAGDDQDCGGFRPGECATEAILEICPGECARVGATAVDGCTTATVTLVGASPGAPPCVGNPCILDFPVAGTFVYTWRAVDEAGNEVECTSTVIVEDGTDCNQPPSCDAGGPGTSDCREAPIDGAVVEDLDGDEVTYSWTSDNPDVTVEPVSGVIGAGVGPRPLPPTVARLDASVDPCGVTATLTLRVDDGRGGVSTCATTVLFLDDQPPVVSSVPPGGGSDVICLWPPNHWYVPVAAADLGVVVTDSCTATTWTVVGCVSDQPDDAPDRGATDPWNGDGRTENDCVVSADGLTIYFRSERCGTGPTAQDGRHYGVAVVATDACGNVSAPTVVGAVHVPHDQSPAEDGCLNPTEIGTQHLP